MTTFMQIKSSQMLSQSRRACLKELGLGLALGSLLSKDGYSKDVLTAGASWAPSNWGSTFRTESQERDLAFHEWRRQPGRKL